MEFFNPTQQTALPHINIKKFKISLTPKPRNRRCRDACFICHGPDGINTDVVCGECGLPQNSHASPDNLDTCDACHRRWSMAVSGGCGGCYTYTDALSTSRRRNALRSPTTSVDREESLYGPDFPNSRIR